MSKFQINKPFNNTSNIDQEILLEGQKLIQRIMNSTLMRKQVSHLQYHLITSYICYVR